MTARGKVNEALLEVYASEGLAGVRAAITDGLLVVYAQRIAEGADESPLLPLSVGFSTSNSLEPARPA